jgi:Na+-translocating ferredoxin:NAD+ oxidoreductase RnfD subunit
MSGRVDPRIAALRRFAISITAFNILGFLFLGFEQAYLTPIVGVATAYAVSLFLETVDAWARHGVARYRGSFTNLVNFLLPAHIAGLACAMLLYANDDLWPTIFAVTVAVSGKYIVRVKIAGAVRHVFNPSNLGISVTLLCFSWVSIAPPYHFTENVSGVPDWLIPAVILASGTMLNAKLTRRMPLIAGWLGGFVLQALVRAVVFHHALDSALLTMVGVAFVLFTNYMITDPGTTPFPPRAQAVFGAATALVYGGLVLMHITFGLFYALTIVCAGRLVLALALRAWRALAVARQPRPLALPVPVPEPRAEEAAVR